MCFLISLLPMTFWLSMAYIVFFLAHRSDGIRQKLGRVLGLWLIGLACCFVILGAYFQLSGSCPIERIAGRIFQNESLQTYYTGDVKGAARRGY